jgi:ATP-dependent Clp protease ATP-binding subunit ClpA
MVDAAVMFERFTKRARHVVVLAQEEARRLDHNYIGTEHILLGLLGEPEGVGAQALTEFGLTLDEARAEVTAIVGRGKKAPSGHIPFTPRAKKTLELSLREALQLHHNYIGTEHILLGVIKEGDGVGAKVLRQHGDLLTLRVAVLDLVATTVPDTTQSRRWSRRRVATDPSGSDSPVEQSELSATPAADVTLSEAARLAGTQPVGSHHLLLAALADPNAAASRALAALGVDLGQAREALQAVDVTGTSDEAPDQAGRRQMLIQVSDDKITVEATDPVLLEAGRRALAAIGDRASPPGTIPGDLAIAAILSTAWQALHDSLVAIARFVANPAQPDSEAKPDESAQSDESA